ncbi:MAG: 50S ribosomal protein L35 [Chloroflexota bacterium]
MHKPRTKLKTHKGAAKRFHITGTGKLLRRKGHITHLRRTKPAKVKRAYSDKLPVHPADKERITRLLPYGVKKGGTSFPK